MTASCLAFSVPLQELARCASKLECFRVPTSDIDRCTECSQQYLFGYRSQLSSVASRTQHTRCRCGASTAVYELALPIKQVLRMSLLSQGPVKCVASASPYVASGGVDDLIHLYDLKVRLQTLQLCAFSWPQIF